MTVKFTVPGEPVGKGRPRFSTVKANGGSFVRTYTPQKTEKYEDLIRWQYAAQAGNTFFPQGSGVSVEILAYFGIPSSASKKRKQAMTEGELRPAKKPDVDNVLKAICDALNGVAYHDDSQIVSARIEKYWSDNPRIEVTIKG